ncbi:MAG: hypothetical protein OEX04_04015 [Acidimicrobiia bacterium]|nr:hypothetical protein [Acidimicrobiia bacterium]MDH5292067.1 hypothetical protein [Acidimicrobiia bacterium]
MSAGLWRPCVGPHLGTNLELGVDDRTAAAVAMVPFSAGLVVAVLGASLATLSLPPRMRHWVQRVALGVGVALGTAVVGGAHTDLVARLARWGQ